MVSVRFLIYSRQVNIFYQSHDAARQGIELLKNLDNWSIDFERDLGKGGYARVFPCSKDNGTSCPAVAKVFKNSTHVNTFEREVAALKDIDGCPNTPRLIDFGRNEQGLLCIITERISGETLEDRVRSYGPLDRRQSIRLLETVLAIIEYTHGAGLAHLDIKASNVMMDGEEFHLLDWGLAKKLKTQFINSINANQDYVAPECFRGSFSAASDFYSLGWLLIFALSGIKPYHFDEVRDRSYRALAHCMERPRLPEGIDEYFIPLALNWLRKEPEHRYLSYDSNDLFDNATGDPADYLRYPEFRTLTMEYSYLESAARHGISYSQYHLARKLIDEQRFEEAIYWLDQAYLTGSSDAACLLARTLTERNGAAASDRILELLNFGVSRENALAKYLLARRILAGEAPGTENQADKLLLSAADSGQKQAQFLYAKRLHKQKAERDLIAKYLVKATVRGSAKAAQFLKLHYS